MNYSCFVSKYIAAAFYDDRATNFQTPGTERPSVKHNYCIAN